jgi:hypothetical protein
MAVTHATAMRNTLCNAVVDAIDAGTDGKLVFRVTGSTADSPSASPPATLTFSATAFGAAANGIATANAITSDTNAAGGTIAFATLEDSAGTVCAHCAVGTSGSDINLSSLTVGAGDTVSVSALTYEAPN